MTLTMLVDDTVPAPVIDVLEAGGHEIRLVADILPAESPDALVAQCARAYGWIVVSWNHTLPAGPSQIAFHGDEDRARPLVSRYLPEIERRLAKARRPLVIEVAEHVQSSIRVRRSVRG